MRNRKARIQRILCTLVFLLALPSFLFSQGYTWMGASLEGLFRNAPWKIGKLRGYRAFYINNAGYDSDIYYGMYEETYPDFTFSTGPSFQWFVPLRKTIILDTTQSVQGLFYFKNKDERALNLRLNGQFHFVFKKFYGQAGLSYSNVRYRFTPEITMNLRYEEIGWHGTFLWQFSRSGSVAWRLRISDLNHGHAQFGETFLDEVLDRKESFADMILYFQPTTKYRFYLDGQVGEYNFKYFESKIRNSYSYALYGGLMFLPAPSTGRATLQGGFNIGYKYLDPKSPQFNDASDIVGNGQITLDLRPSITIRAFYSRDFNVSIYSSLLHYLNTAYGGGFTFHIRNRVDFGNQITLSTSNYPLATEPEENDRRLKFTAVMANLGIRIAREVYFSLNGMIARRTIYPEGLKFSRHVIGFSLTYGSLPGEMGLPIASTL